MKVSTATFSGHSGQKYQFFVYPMSHTFDSVGAVYAVSRRYRNSRGGYSYHIIYMDETNDLASRLGNQDELDCYARRHANCICSHRDDDRDSRLAKKDDLLRHRTPDCNG